MSDFVTSTNRSVPNAVASSGCAGQAVDEVHHIERTLVDIEIIAEADRAWHWHIAVLKRVDHSELTSHIVGALKNLKQRRSTKDPVAILLVGDLEGQVRVAASDEVEIERGRDRIGMRGEPGGDVVTIDSFGSHFAPRAAALAGATRYPESASALESRRLVSRCYAMSEDRRPLGSYRT